MEIDSKEISKMRVTDSQLITPHSADLIQIIVTHSTGTANWKVYDGENTSGDLVLDMKTQYTRNFTFPHGMYMRRGIYFYRDTKVQSALIRWRNRPSKEG